MQRQVFRILTVFVVLTAFLNGSAPSAVYAKSAPLCLSGVGFQTLPSGPYIAFSRSFPVQTGDVVVATISTGVSGLGETASVVPTGPGVQPPKSNSNLGPSVSVSWTNYVSFGATGASGSFFGGSQFRWQVSLNGGICASSKNTLNFTDGRCNQEPWQSFAVYPDGKGGYYFYAIYQGVGYYAMHVTEKMLDENPDTGVNHVIAQADGVQLWRLAGGALQATRIGLDNKLYSFNITCGLSEDGD
ncbi:MAG TPA: hypothetical protein VKQ72_03985 [Aggregatilineales bacterium]|nr:hypothetical protein [Aggregatilineales bacterium]